MRPQFRIGDRVRVTGAFGAPLEGALGRVDEVITVDIGDGAVAYDVVVLLEELQTIFTHSAHNFEYIDEPPKGKGKGGEPFAGKGKGFGQDCGRTKYSKKRRLLRNHRTNMRIMNDIIEEHDLSDELEQRLIDETGNTNFWLGEDNDMDEDSDQEDPEALATNKIIALLHENDDKQSLVEAVQGALSCRAMATDLDRARMQLEDLRAQMSR